MIEWNWFLSLRVNFLEYRHILLNPMFNKYNLDRFLTLILKKAILSNTKSFPLKNKYQELINSIFFHPSMSKYHKRHVQPQAVSSQSKCLQMILEKYTLGKEK